MCEEKICQLCVKDSGCDTVDKKKDFSAKEFVDNLLSKGVAVPCDSTSEAFNNQKLPPYYDEQMFKRGQAVFHKHIFGMFLGCFLGLLCNLSSKASLAILMLTNMSSTDLTAYKRYTATILHMMVWYDSCFKPGSTLWKSIEDVKYKHNSASKKANCVLKYGINQNEMALTQFGFMGLAVTRSSYLGLYNMSEEDQTCFVHVWRIIGYSLGIEEKFNICRESLKETKAICNELIARVFQPAIQNHDNNYRRMVKHLINGMTAMNPVLSFDPFLLYLKLAMGNVQFSTLKDNDEYHALSSADKFKLKMITVTIRMMRFYLIRIILNYMQRWAIHAARSFSCIAARKFGKENASVSILKAK